MDIQPAEKLRAAKCKPCEGGIEPCSIAHSQQQLAELRHWKLSENGKIISRQWKLKDFAQAVQLLNACAEIAEQEQHHPDLHLTGYRWLSVDLTTHAIDGLSENDFIVASKIDSLAEAR
jgi:4a-hydroxytetrahydrobiopterin dehydratase